MCVHAVVCCYCPVSLPYGAIDSFISVIVAFSVHTDLLFNISIVKSKLVTNCT